MSTETYKYGQWDCTLEVKPITITDEEMEYIKNDVLVLKEALEFMFVEGHKS